MEWDDDLIAAYADGELHALIEYRFEEALERDDALRTRVEQHRRLRTRIGAHYEPVMQEPVPERLRALLETRPGATVTSIETARRRRLPRQAWIPAAIAASLAVGLFGGQLLTDGSPVGVTSMPAASSELAAALDTQLASAPAQGDQPRVGVTFRDTDGRVCRTFDGEVAGFACRNGGRWQVELLAPGSAPHDGEFRQAASGAMLVLQAAQERMAGEPLGADEERRLRDAGWR